MTEPHSEVSPAPAAPETPAHTPAAETTPAETSADTTDATDTTDAPQPTEGRAPAQRGRRGQRAQPQRPPGADASGKGPRGVPRAPLSNPALEQLAALYPQLFGAEFLPLKRGIFQDLLSAHPEVFEREALKAALALHTRSSRYLSAVAAGLARHDLQGVAVEAMAPEHVYQALLEIFRRRHGRSGEDLRPKLRQRMVQAYEASGLSSPAYGDLMRGKDEAANLLLDEALAQANASAAKDEALLRAFEASGHSVEAFADMYGLEPRDAQRTLARARGRR